MKEREGAGCAGVRATNGSTAAVEGEGGRWRAVLRGMEEKAGGKLGGAFIAIRCAAGSLARARQP